MVSFSALPVPVDALEGARVWWARTSSYDPGLLASLSAPERHRAESYSQVEDSHRFVVGASLLRTVLGGIVGVDPRGLRITRSCARCGAQHGRPRLVEVAHAPHASVTHSAGVVGVAVHADAPLGLDVERVRPVAFTSLMPSLMAPGEEAPTSSVQFLARWTRKEAVLKATGEGLFRPMSEIRVDGAVARLVESTGAGIAALATVAEVPAPDGYLGAVAVLT